MKYFIYITLFCGSVFGQVQLAWQDVYIHPAPGSFDYARDIAIDADGNTYITGESNSNSHGFFMGFTTIKYAPDGTREWIQEYANNLTDQGTDLAVDHDGNIVVTGFSFTADGRGISVVKYNPAGAIIWDAFFLNKTGGFDKTSDLAIDQNNDIYICGHVNFGDALVLKVNAAGKLAWRKTFAYPNASGHVPENIVIDAAGNAVVGGHVGFGPPGVSAMILKYSPDGDLLWENGTRLFFEQGSESTVAVDDAGNIFIAGRDSTGFTLQKYQPNGAAAAQTRYHIASRDSAIGLMYHTLIDSQGNIVLVGEIQRSPIQFSIIVLKYSPTLQLLWQRIAKFGQWQLKPVATLDSNDRLYISGGDIKTKTMAYDANGNLLWQITDNLPNSDFNEPNAIVADANGNVFVGGVQKQFLSDYDFFTMKYAPVTTGIAAPETGAETFRLLANYPNPFNPETVIPFELPRDGKMELAIYNIAGQKIATLFSGNQSAGRHELRWIGTLENGTAAASGVYFAQLAFGNQRRTVKLLLAR